MDIWDSFFAGGFVPDPVAPERQWEATGPMRKWGGDRYPVRSAKNYLFVLVVPLHFFGSKSTISRFGERFYDGQYSVVSFLFAVFYLRCLPRAQPFVKVGKARAPLPYGVNATAQIPKLIATLGHRFPAKDLY